jgi:hypothetical protein
MIKSSIDNEGLDRKERTRAMDGTIGETSIFGGLSIY